MKTNAQLTAEMLEMHHDSQEKKQHVFQHLECCAWIFLVAPALIPLSPDKHPERTIHITKCFALLDISFLSDSYNVRTIVMTVRYSWAVMRPRGYYYYASKDDSERVLMYQRSTRRPTCGSFQIIIIFISFLTTLTSKLEVNSVTFNQNVNWKFNLWTNDGKYIEDFFMNR